jgi:hypothetical protein
VPKGELVEKRHFRKGYAVKKYNSYQQEYGRPKTM